VWIQDTGEGFSPDRPPQPRPPSGKNPGGFGLLILDRLSSRWGIERDERGFRVWFRLGDDGHRG